MQDHVTQTYEALLEASRHLTDHHDQLAGLLAEHAGARLMSLASAQLNAYNHADLDAFCACYAPHVQVYQAGELICEGAEAFRGRYEPLFSGGGFGASVAERALEPLPATLTEGGVSVRCVDVEDWWRGPVESQRTGRVWVRYHLRLTLLRALTGGADQGGADLGSDARGEAPRIERVEFSERPFV